MEQSQKREDGAEMPSNGLSRRGFLRLAGVSGAMAAAMGLGATTGCTSNQSTDEPAQEGVSLSGANAFRYETYDTDVLIVGAGNAATAAAYSALKDGVKVMMVEKGPLLASGASNMTWGGFSNGFDLNPDTPLSEQKFDWLGAPISEFLINSPLWRNALNLYKTGERDEDAEHRSATLMNRGHYLTYRNEDGSVKTYGSTMTNRLYMRHELDTLIARSMVDIRDWTMITDFIIEDGVCCGAIGLHLPTGIIRVFRAKATIMATFTSCQMFGFSTTRPYTVSACDNTSETDASLYRHGIACAEHEFAQYDAKAIDPAPFACGMGSITCDAQNAALLIDAKGDSVFEDVEKANDRNYFCQTLGRKSLEGGVFIDVSKFEGGSFAHGIDDFRLLILNSFGIDPNAQPIEASPNMYEKGGAPVVDENLMTEAKGLFCTRGAGTNGENGGSCLYNNNIFGNYAGYTAAQYAKKLDAAPAFSWNIVAAEHDRLEAFRTNNASDGIHPSIIRHNIQNTFHKAFGPYRPVANIESAIAELERIKSDDMPRQIVSDTSLALNKDWQEAIENENLLTISLISLKATYERTESRGSYVRDDYPEQDDENWNCMLVCRKVGDEMTFEKKELPTSVE